MRETDFKEKLNVTAGRDHHQGGVSMFKWFKDLKIGNKLFLGFGAVLLILVILSTIVFINTSQCEQVVAENIFPIK